MPLNALLGYNARRFECYYKKWMLNKGVGWMLSDHATNYFLLFLGHEIIQKCIQSYFTAVAEMAYYGYIIYIQRTTS